MIALVLVALAAEHDVLPLPPAAGAIAQVQAVIESDAELLHHHRGYLAYLERHPDSAAAEETFSELNVLAGFRQVVNAFDETLVADLDAQNLYNRYFDALARDPALCRSVEALHRCQFELRGMAHEFEALAFIREHPDDAVAMLESETPRANTPVNVRSFLRTLRKHPAIRRELLQALRAILERPFAYTHIFPWWHEACGTGVVAEASRRLENYFLRHQHHFWVWHRRQVVLASTPHARDWIRYWRRCIRRQPVLAQNYDACLPSLRDHRNAREPVAKDKELPNWPPDEMVPELSPLEQDKLVNESLPDEKLAPSPPSKPHMAPPIPPNAHHA